VIIKKANRKAMYDDVLVIESDDKTGDKRKRVSDDDSHVHFSPSTAFTPDLSTGNKHSRREESPGFVDTPTLQYPIKTVVREKF
jgi:hypothetical protein